MSADKAHTSQLHTAALVGVSALCLLSSLLGCSMGPSSAKSVSPVTALTAKEVQGHVHGGQQAVSGATIQLYAAGTPASGGGYGVGATALIPTGSYSPGGQPGCTGGNCTTLPHTDANGNFSITGDYTCPASVSQIYIVASGGNPGLGGTVNNTNLAMLAALGPCPANGNLLAAVPFINIDEVTTVAGVWALQQFMAAPSSGNALAPAIGAPGTGYSNNLSSPTSVQSAVIGLQNSFTTAKVLADISTGLSPNTNYAYATPESAKINTFADILAYCINSDPSSTANCGNLLAAATPIGFPAAKDTIQAAWYMAQNPSTNYASLYAFVGGAGAPFQPTVGAPTTAAPGDFTIAISYAPTYNNGGTATFGVAAPFGVAIDAYGNAWFSNDGGLTNNSAFASGVELGADGSVIAQPLANYTVCHTATCGAHALFTVTPSLAAHSFTAPRGIAIDLSNNAWITDSNDSIATPAVPSAGAVAVLNGSTSTGLAGNGGGSGATGYYVNNTPIGIAIDGSDHVFISSGTTNAVSATTILGARSVAKLSANGGTGFVFSNQSSAAAPNSTPGGQALLAIDANSSVGAGGMVWALNSSGCKVQGNYQATITPWGTINEFMDVDLSSPTGSEAVSTYAAPSLGAGSSTNCGTSGITVGQILAAGMANPFGIAIDHENGAFISDTLTSSVGFDGLTYIRAPTGSSGVAPSSFSVVDGSAGSSSAAPTAGTTLQKAAGVAVDGNGRAWIVNQSTNSIVEVSFSAGTFTFYTPGAGGAGGVGFVHPISGSGVANDIGVAIDPSGNVWVSSTNASATYINQLGASTKTANSATVIVGAAAPVVTPLSLAIANNALGAKP
jgi:hypothetical protein